MTNPTCGLKNTALNDYRIGGRLDKESHYVEDSGSFL